MTTFTSAAPSHVTATRVIRRRGFSALELLIVCAILEDGNNNDRVDDGERVTYAALGNGSRGLSHVEQGARERLARRVLKRARLHRSITFR